jgi:signal transduction histidine kinase
MKTIRAKLNLTMFLMLGSAIGFGTMAYKNNEKLERWQDRVSLSLQIRDHVQEINTRDKKRSSLQPLKDLKQDASEIERYEAVSNLIQAYNANNPKLYEARIKEFERVERKFFKFAQWKIKKFKGEVRFFLVLATVLPLLGLCGLIYYFNYGVLSPLQTLSHRMMEFLIDQYTFRFSSPPNNEIGNLERTFNSLAQKVLNNMDELKALDRAKSEFVSIASHELRTPLTSIKGSLGLLSNDIVGTLDPESKDMVLVAEQETDRLVRLINDMLDLAKIESRSLTLKTDWVPLMELLERTAQGLKGFAAAAQVKIHVTSQVPEALEVAIDPDRIQQVITNLVSNAIKYSPQKGTVTVMTQVTLDGRLEVSITDQGDGISEENQSLIFEKFRQATDANNQLVKGTGLGLAISKALIEEHHGEIGVRSVEGQGSTFYFTLPKWRKIVNAKVTDSNKVA